jgi:MFS transporter, ACS family, tartrate transporter
MEAIADRTHLQVALRKAQWKLIPLLAAGYLVAYMDRTNISFAAEPMNRQLHFSPQVYGLGAGLFFISYALCEIPSNRLLLQFGARRWLARILLTWGLLAVAMMFVRSPPSFYGMRLLLGAAEAGYFPGVIYYLSQWFPASQRGRAISWFYVSLPLSTVLMGSVAGSLLRLDGRLGLAGWQWLFLVEGLPAMVLGIWFWLALPDSPTTAAWLTQPERAAIAEELTPPAFGHPTQRSLLKVLREPRVWLVGIFAFCMLGMSYSVSFFLPIMLSGLSGWTPSRVGYMIAASGVLAAAAMILNAVHSDRRCERRWHIVIPMLSAGALALIAGLHMHGILAALALLLFLTPYMAMQGPLLVLASTLCPGENSAFAIATFNMCGILGGFAGPYWMGWMRELTGAYAVGIAGLILPSLFACGCLLWLTRRPRPTAYEPQRSVA